MIPGVWKGKQDVGGIPRYEDAGVLEITDGDTYSVDFQSENGRSYTAEREFERSDELVDFLQEIMFEL